MSENIELRQQRAALIRQARELVERAEAEKRDLNAEEQQQYDRIIADAEAIGKRVERMELVDALERGLSDSIARRADTDSGDRNAHEARAAFAKWLARGPDALNATEQRALSVGDAMYGGFLVPPPAFISDLLAAVDNAVFVRRYATVYRVGTTDSLGVPTLESDPADAEWTTEIGTVNEDSSLSFGKRDLRPMQLTKLIKVSRRLLNVVPAVEQLVINRLAYKFGVTEEKAFLSGTGAGQPLGVFIASNNGIPASRDVSTGNTTTSITFDNLITVKYTLKAQYHPRARWLFHRDAVAMIAKLKDNDGQYIWYPSVRDGEPDRLLSFPVDMSEYAPNTFTAGRYVGLLADWRSGYWIVDGQSMEIQRLVELYAATSQVGIVARMWADGAPVLDEAFVRVQLAAS